MDSSNTTLVSYISAGSPAEPGTSPQLDLRSESLPLNYPIDEAIYHLIPQTQDERKEILGVFIPHAISKLEEVGEEFIRQGTSNLRGLLRPPFHSPLDPSTADLHRELYGAARLVRLAGEVPTRSNSAVKDFLANRLSGRQTERLDIYPPEDRSDWANLRLDITLRDVGVWGLSGRVDIPVTVYPYRPDLTLYINPVDLTGTETTLPESRTLRTIRDGGEIINSSKQSLTEDFLRRRIEAGIDYLRMVITMGLENGDFG